MVNILTHKRWCNHCKEHVNLEVHHETCEFARLQKQNELLHNSITRAYWLIEVCDRVEALKELSKYAGPRDSDAPHWLTTKQDKS